MMHIAGDFERLRTTLYHEEPDRVPSVELFHDAEIKKAFLGRNIKDIRSDIEFFVNAGYDYYSLWFTYSPILLRGELPVSETSTHYNKKKKIRRWTKEKGGIISTMEDFRSFPWGNCTKENIVVSTPGIKGSIPVDKAIEEVRKYLPKKMKLIAMVDGIYERFTKMMGFETFCYNLVDQPRLIEQMFEKVGQLWLELFKYMASIERVGALWLADDIAYSEGLLFSPKLMRKYLFPWYKKIGQVAYEHNLPFLFHSDGKLYKVIENIIECGFSAIQPVEPKAMDIKKLKKKYGNRLCLIGNIDLGYTLTRGTPQEIEEEVRQRIRDIAPGGGYCVGSSNSVTDYVPLENFKTMLEATVKYGKYPISV